MNERRRLKAGVEVRVEYRRDYVTMRYRDSGGVYVTIIDPLLVPLITEPIPKEPAGPKVGDKVTASWLVSEWGAGRHHVVRNPDGSAASWAAEVDGTRSVCLPGGYVAGHDSGGTWPLLALHPVERWEEPEPDPTEPPLDVRMDRAERRIEALERWREEHSSYSREMFEEWHRFHAARALEKVTPNPKEVMPDAGGSIADDDSTRDVAPPPGADEDAPGGDEPSVEGVLLWLEDGGWFNEDKAHAAARIIRERGEEIERLTERLTITPEKEKAARGKVYVGSFSGDLGHVRAALRAAGMIDPEAGSELPTPRKIATKEDVERVAQAIYGGTTWQKLNGADHIYREMARRALIAMGYEIEEGA